MKQIFFKETSNEDIEAAHRHCRREVITVRCAECGQDFAFKISTRFDRNEIHILAYVHDCPPEEGRTES